MECTVHTGGTRFITTRLLASPVQSFLSKAVDFSLAFPFSSISTYRTSQSQPYRVCQTWLQRARSELRESEVGSALWPPPSLPRLSSRGSTHTTVARGTALWESLVGKPRGKDTDPLIHAKGSATLLLQLERKAHVHAPTREED